MRPRNFVLPLLFCASSVAFCSSYSSIVVFGDSLSDAGNASIATAGAVPGPGYASRTVPGIPFPVGYYTNPQSGSGAAGLWVDQLAAKLGLPDPLPALGPLGGSNFAVGGADTASGLGNMNVQLGLFLTATGGTAPSSALYTFWGGANDIFDGLNPVSAADNIASQILTLHAAGANNFLWLDLPSLGNVPGLVGTPASAVVNAASALFDAEWASKLMALDALGINVIGVDINGLFNAVTSNPGAFGFTNVTTACNATPGCNPNTALYWDSDHPTTAADALVANLAYQDLAQTPEPPSAALLSIGCLFAACITYSRHRKIGLHV